MEKISINKSFSVFIIFLAFISFALDSVYAQTQAPNTVVWSTPYNLKSGHTIYLSSMNVQDGCGYFYVNVNGQITDNLPINDSYYDDYFGTLPTTENSTDPFDDSDLEDDQSSSSPIWFTSTSDDTEISFGVDNCGGDINPGDADYTGVAYGQVGNAVTNWTNSVTNLNNSGAVSWTTPFYWVDENGDIAEDDEASLSLTFKEYSSITLPNLGPLLYPQKLSAFQASVQTADTAYNTKRNNWLASLAAQGAHAAQYAAGNPAIDGVLYRLDRLLYLLQAYPNGSFKYGSYRKIFWQVNQLKSSSDPLIQDVVTKANALLGFSYLYTPTANKPILIVVPGDGGDPMTNTLLTGVEAPESQYFNVILYAYDPSILIGDTNNSVGLAHAFLDNYIAAGLNENQNLIFTQSYGCTILHAAILYALQNGGTTPFSNSYAVVSSFVLAGASYFSMAPQVLQNSIGALVGDIAPTWNGIVTSMNPSYPLQSAIANNINAIQQATQGIFYMYAVGDDLIDWNITGNLYATNRNLIQSTFNGGNYLMVTPPTNTYLGNNNNPHDNIDYSIELKTQLQSYINILQGNIQQSPILPPAQGSGSSVTISDINSATSASDDAFSLLTLYQDGDLGNEMVEALKESLIVPGGDYQTTANAVNTYLGQEPDWTFNEIQQIANNALETAYNVDYLDEPDFISVDNQTLLAGQSLSFPVSIGQNLSISVSANSYADDGLGTAASSALKRGSQARPATVSSKASSDEFTFSALNLPSGASVDPISGAFTWTPQTGQNGTFTVWLTVTDSLGLYGYLPISIVSGTGVNPSPASIVWSGSIAASSGLPTITMLNNVQYPLTNSPTISLTLSANETNGMGATKMQFSVDNVNWSSPQVYATSASYTFPSGTIDGIKSIYVKFSDVQGNWSGVYSTSVVLDTTPPANASILINGGASYTISDSVNLTLSASDNLTGVIWMALSNDNVNWTKVLYNTSYAWNLPAALTNGSTQEVYVKYEDGAGNWSLPINASIQLQNEFYSITSSVNGTGGSISPLGSQNMSYGSSQVFTLTPNAGYVINNLLLDNNPVTLTNSNTYTLNNITGNHNLVASFSLPAGLPGVPSIVTAFAAASNTAEVVFSQASPNGSAITKYTVTSSPGGIITNMNPASCGTPLCGATVTGLTNGITYTFTVSATNNIGTGSASAPSQGVVTVASTQSQALLAGPLLENETPVVGSAVTQASSTNPVITASAGSGGSINPSGTLNYPNGSTQIFKITADKGYTIDQVSVDGSPVALTADNKYTFTNLNAPHTITANFTNNTYIITVKDSTGGSISPSGNVLVNYGASQSFSITPNSDYSINQLLLDGKSITPTASNTFTLSNVTGPHTLAASFNPVIKANAGTGGTITPAGTVAYPIGSIPTFRITASAGYSIDKVLVDGSAVSLTADHKYMFSRKLTAPHTITASFTINKYSMTVSAGAGGRIKPSGNVVLDYGSSQMFSVTPVTGGYRVSQLLLDGRAVTLSANHTYTLNNVTGEHTLTASFDPVIMASAGAGGSISPNGTASYSIGSTQTFEITAKKGYVIDQVLIDGSKVSLTTDNKYTFTNITRPHTIIVSFMRLL